MKKFEEHLMYKGKDGKDYSTPEQLKRADEKYNREHFQYKGRDGKDYETVAQLNRANAEFGRTRHEKKGSLPKIINDKIERIEIKNKKRTFNMVS